MMWAVIFIAMIIFAVVSVIYLVSRFHQFGFVKQIAEKHKVLSWFVAVIPVALVACSYFYNISTMIVLMIHLFVAFLLCDIVFLLIRKISGKEFRYDYQGGIAILLTVLYLGVGWYNAHNVWQTDYTIHTDKDLGKDSVRVVGFADSHLGITLDGEKFSEQMKRIQQTNPDVVIIAGDFVDDYSDKDDMIASCRAMGELETTYGVYFVLGNHDEGYFNRRNFTAQELLDELEKNHVTVLEDESVLLNDSFYIVGRKDRSTPDRMDMETLMSNLDKSKYAIVIDHQPNDYAAEAASGADLVFSGHTHGGHIFPAGWIGLAMGANDRVYGTEIRENTTFVVTSGISGWAIPFKTGTFSEFVVLDIEK